MFVIRGLRVCTGAQYVKKCIEIDLKNVRLELCAWSSLPFERRATSADVQQRGSNVAANSSRLEQPGFTAAVLEMTRKSPKKLLVFVWKVYATWLVERQLCVLYLLKMTEPE